MYDMARNSLIKRAFGDESVTDITDLPVYSIASPKTDSLKILNILLRNNGNIKKKKLIERLEGERLIDHNLSLAAKHRRLKALLNPLVSTVDTPLVKVDYLGR